MKPAAANLRVRKVNRSAFQTTSPEGSTKLLNMLMLVLPAYRTRGPNGSGSKFNVGIVYDASPPEELLQAFLEFKAELETLLRVRTELIATRRKSAECKSDPNSVYTKARPTEPMPASRAAAISPITVP